MRIVSTTFLISYFFFLISFSSVFAHEPHIIDTPAQNDVLPLKDPDISQVLYGNLEGYPHMYEFYTKKPIQLFVEVLVPDIPLARKNVSGIILRVNKNGSVTEIARLSAKEATWESFYEWWGGDSYLRGASYTGNIEPGLYRVEASTPENIGKYALVVGTEERWRLGYFGLLGELIRVKHFFGKSSFAILESPLVFVPVLLTLLGSLGGVWYVFRRRRGGSIK